MRYTFVGSSLPKQGLIGERLGLSTSAHLLLIDAEQEQCQGIVVAKRIARTGRGGKRQYAGGHTPARQICFPYGNLTGNRRTLDVKHGSSEIKRRRIFPQNGKNNSRQLEIERRDQPGHAATGEKRGENGDGNPLSPPFSPWNNFHFSNSALWKCRFKKFPCVIIIGPVNTLRLHPAYANDECLEHPTPRLPAGIRSDQAQATHLQVAEHPYLGIAKTPDIHGSPESRALCTP